MSDRLADQQVLSSTSAIALIANGENVKTHVAFIRFFNQSATTSALIKLYRVPDSSGSLGTPTANHQFEELILHPRESAYIEEWIILADENDAIFVQSSVANIVNCSADGIIENAA